MKNKKRKKNVDALNATRLDNLGQATQKVWENQRKNIHFAEQDPCSRLFLHLRPPLYGSADNGHLAVTNIGVLFNIN
jgi:hypothetical protein